ncbi:MAG: hypothetical protein JF626_01555 [Polaromonas sp.]|nr:hypothetical protein [Polaromonas sp.]
MKFFVLGLVLLIGGIPLMNVNFYLGWASIGVGAILAQWFRGDVMAAQRRRLTQRLEEAQTKAELRKQAKK